MNEKNIAFVFYTSYKNKKKTGISFDDYNLENNNHSFAPKFVDPIRKKELKYCSWHSGRIYNDFSDFSEYAVFCKSNFEKHYRCYDLCYLIDKKEKELIVSKIIEFNEIFDKLKFMNQSINHHYSLFSSKLKESELADKTYKKSKILLEQFDLKKQETNFENEYNVLLENLKESEDLMNEEFNKVNSMFDKTLLNITISNENEIEKLKTSFFSKYTPYINALENYESHKKKIISKNNSINTAKIIYNNEKKKLTQQINTLNADANKIIDDLKNLVKIPLFEVMSAIKLSEKLNIDLLKAQIEDERLDHFIKLRSSWTKIKFSLNKKEYLNGLTDEEIYNQVEQEILMNKKNLKDLMNKGQNTSTKVFVPVNSEGNRVRKIYDPNTKKFIDEVISNDLILQHVGNFSILNNDVPVPEINLANTSINETPDIPEIDFDNLTRSDILREKNNIKRENHLLNEYADLYDYEDKTLNSLQYFKNNEKTQGGGRGKIKENKRK